jgi:hypothetical protein
MDKAVSLLFVLGSVCLLVGSVINVIKAWL